MLENGEDVNQVIPHERNIGILLSTVGQCNIVVVLALNIETIDTCENGCTDCATNDELSRIICIIIQRLTGGYVPEIRTVNDKDVE